jgi:hypothetical protein
VSAVDVDEAVLKVLADSDAPLHWTVIQDRALKAGLVDPFTTRDVRAQIGAALRDLVRTGRARRVSTGVYEVGGEADPAVR